MTHLFDVFLRLPKLRLKDTNQKVLKPFDDDENREETAEPCDQPIGSIIKNEKGFKGTIPRGTHDTLDASYESLVTIHVNKFFSFFSIQFENLSGF